MDSIQPAAAAKGIRLRVEVANPAEPVFADSERIQQVLWNLLTNALKFSEKGDEVRVECGRVGTKFQITVADTGEGIDPEFLPFLFERFTQADASKTRKHGGLGLGLAIVRHIVESHGGAVIAHSKGKGHGSVFIVQLPIPAVQPEPPAASRTKDASLKDLRVMLIEDEFDTREMVAEILEQSGATVFLAASASEALRILLRQTPDVIVSDIGLPEMDGYQLIGRIRSDYPRLANTPAIALTAYAKDEDQRKSVSAGYQAFLIKPIAVNQLNETIVSIRKSKAR